MRAAGLAVLGLLAGFLAGIALSELIGVVGYLAFEQKIGMKYLALYTAAVGAIGATLRTARRRR